MRQIFSPLLAFFFINTALAGTRYTPNPNSQEWKTIGDTHFWEVTRPSIEDFQGAITVDKESLKVKMGKKIGYTPLATPASEKIPYLGQIIAARSEYSTLTVGDIIFIEALGDIQSGETYTITDPPSVLGEKKQNQQYYSYLNLGKVKIIGIRDRLYIGSIVEAKFPIHRSHYLISDTPFISEMNAIPALESKKAITLHDHKLLTGVASEGNFIFLNLGSQDGIQAGMVFRAYQQYDPASKKRITNSHFVVLGEMLVIQTSPKFSSALVFRSNNLIPEGTEVFSMKDVSHILREKSASLKKYNNKTNSNEISELDRLDALNENEPIENRMGEEEAKTLQQLKSWKNSPPQTSPLHELAPDKKPSPTPSTR